MKIVEIFESIQGEGGFMGVPCIFIRASGCNLTCDFCDTKKSWDMNAGMDMSIDEIMMDIEKYSPWLVVITGGEPCMQDELPSLCQRLSDAGKTVALETNGTLPTPHYIHYVACSPKACADYFIHPECAYAELKFVVTPDFDPSVITQEMQDKARHIWLQPEGGDMQKMWMKCYEIAMQNPNLRVGAQLHKLMEVE